MLLCFTKCYIRLQGEYNPLFIQKNFILLHRNKIALYIMESTQVEVNKKLLEINTIKIQPDNPFTWASGWKSPIYCDNRKTLSYPDTRAYIRDCFVNLIKEKYP